MKFKCSRCFSPLPSENALYETVAGFKNSPVCPGCSEDLHKAVAEKVFDKFTLHTFPKIGDYMKYMKKKMMKVFYELSPFLKENPDGRRKTATELNTHTEARPNAYAAED